MSEIEKLKLEAYLAFREMYIKWYDSPYNMDKEFLEQMMDCLAPLDYFETHYTFTKELREYMLPSREMIVFDKNHELRNAFKETKVYGNIDGKELTVTNPSPVTFIGDVHVKGNLKIAWENTVFVLGDLIVDRVLTCEPDTMLMVAGCIMAKGLGVESGINKLAICAEQINIAEFLYAESAVYAGEIRSKLLIGRKAALSWIYDGYVGANKSISPKLVSPHLFLLPIPDITPIKALCNPAIFGKPVFNVSIDDLLYDLFRCLEEGTVVFNDDAVSFIDSIFKE